jgi:hypothetical protein
MCNNVAVACDADPRETAVLCGTADAARLPFGGRDVLRLRRHGPQANVFVEIDDIEGRAWAALPHLFRDLIDIAAYVYAADQSRTRGGLDDARYGARWRRRMFFRIAVEDPDFWNGPDVIRELVAALSFLSEDEYVFEFVRLPSRVSAGRLKNPGPPFGGVPEGVMLFSGGLDSFAGAAREVIADRRKVLLVNHRSTTKLGPRQISLVNNLAERARQSPRAGLPLLLPVRVSKSSVLTEEYTQRTRSFLYASLAAAVTSLLRQTEFRVYENGVVSLNLPPCAQVVGARASRTTHPAALAGFERVFSLVAGRRFRVENPFRWHTRTEVVRDLAGVGCADLIGETTSCQHTRRLSHDRTHCGLCSQCIDRRFAVLAAGQEAHDPADRYGVDLIVGERPTHRDRTMLASYLATAERVGRMTPPEFLAEFGEVSRVLGCTGGDPEADLAAACGLYARHANQVLGVVDRSFGRHGTAIREGTLPPHCLLRMVYDNPPLPDPAPPAPPDAPSAPDYFRRKGDVWEVRFDGGEPFMLTRCGGAEYLHLLLSNPGQTFTPSEAVVRVTGRRPRVTLAGGDASDTAETLRAYRLRCADLREGLDQAKEDNDAGLAAALQSELDQVIDFIRRDLDFRGRLRSEINDRERVRKRVRVSIYRAIKRVANYDASLAAYLRSSRFSYGSGLRFDPDAGRRWDTG